GALAAGLLGGISEPSLYGIHLRYKRIYPRMLIGCATGGLTIGILGWIFTPVTTGAFAFTSLLTIPVFAPMWIYVISIAAAFVVAMILVIASDYRTAEQKAEWEAELAQADMDLALERERNAKAAAAPAAAAAAETTGGGVATMVRTDVVAAPVAGKVIALEDVKDKVFASKALGEGVGIEPSDGHVVAPVTGVLVTVPDSGHAFGIKTDDGVEVLVHVGIDTVQLGGRFFSLDVKQHQRVEAGDLLAKVDLDGVRSEGYDTTTIVVVINTMALASVAPRTVDAVGSGDPIIDVTP
ncbi:MAG: PTS glucose transporter subunit IIA, partial [Propionibacteriaceae bacterium]|nr:PTS glucose transporter subunit IIA [Propionibacteriaceae bacterium]